MLEQIDYKKVFTYFEEISDVPRGSYYNEKISDYLVRFASGHGLAYDVDDAFNVIIKKPASGGCTATEPIMLQGHMDMVCVSEDLSHDFHGEGLPLRVMGDYIDSKGTTLGGDDGIALAYCLAILDSSEIAHPPLEVVFTTDEEVGMLGADALDTSKLQSKRLINIDNEEEGVLLVSCAGGALAHLDFMSEQKMMNGYEIEVNMEHFAGGHSGTEIISHPLNASIALGRLLYTAWRKFPFCLSSFEGGDKDNVITKDAYAHIVCEKEEDAKSLYEIILQYSSELKEEILSSEPDVEVHVVQPKAFSDKVFSQKFSEQFFQFLNLTITGVQVMSSDVDNMVESSLNMGIAGTKENGIELGFLIRSQKETYRDHMLVQLETLANCVAKEDMLIDFKVSGIYPSWDYKRDSKLRSMMVEQFKKVFGRAPKVEGIHAGLECGVFSKKIPELDIVSMGPDILDIHTVNERMSISSVKNNFDFLLAVLEQLSNE